MLRRPRESDADVQSPSPEAISNRFLTLRFTYFLNINPGVSLYLFERNDANNNLQERENKEKQQKDSDNFQDNFCPPIPDGKLFIDLRQLFGDFA